MSRTYQPKPCANCTRTFTPTGPAALYCSDDCRHGAAEDRKAQRGYDENGQMTGAFAGALATVTLNLRNRPAPLDLTLPGLGQIVKHAVTGHRAKDRAIYAEALTELAGWALLELARVRPGDDATA